MTRPSPIDLAAVHRRPVLNILRAHLPASAKLWVFGSRATGRARRYSDLDLAIDIGRPMTLDETAALAEAFSDSDLPYRVDRSRRLAGGRLPLAAENYGGAGGLGRDRPP